MTKIVDKKFGRVGDRTDPKLGDRVNDRHIELPNSLRGKSAHDIWGPEGPGQLLSRLKAEYRFGQSASSPLSNEELATLIDLYEDKPSLALRAIVIRELRNERAARPGPKANHTPSQWLDEHLLPIYHERAKRIADWQRRRLMRREKRKKRREAAETIPTKAMLAMRFVRNWLPSMRHLSDKTIANKISNMKDPSEKTRRTKSADR